MSVNFNNFYGKISNSGHDEYGRIRGGKAGDQTKKEWEIKSWYSRPWTCVLRYPKQKARELIAELSIEAALNDNVGYDQGQRGTYWTELVKANYRPSKIKTKCQVDCSAGVIANTKAVGYLLNINELKNVKATYTGNLKTGFKNAGFQVLTDKKYLTGYDYLVPGDILLYEGHHVATNLGIGKKSNYKPLTNTDSSKLNRTPKFIGVVTGAYYLNVRVWAGKEYDNLKSIPVIKEGTEVEVCDTVKDKNKQNWYYVRIKGTTYGFVSAKYITKK